MPHGKRRRDRSRLRAPRAGRPSVRVWLGLALMAAMTAAAWVLLHGSHPKEGLPAQFKTGAASGYNVLLITLDTTRADHLGCYGDKKAETPVLDGLAREGVLFGDAVATAPITLPSHASMMTGLYPPDHGARNNGDFRVAPEQETLAEVLKKAGYDTAAFVSVFVLGSQFGLDQGFDVYDDNVGIGQSQAGDDEAVQRRAGDVTQAAIRWLDQRGPDRPFFAWVHYYDPHMPYVPPPPFDRRFRKNPYDGEIAYMDSQIGVLLQALQAHGLREKTLIVAAADHGEGLGDHHESTHARLIYESVMHIPLIVSCPSLFPGSYRVDQAVVSCADIFPTVLDLLGIPQDRRLDGISLRTCLEERDREVYLECAATYLEEGWAPLFGLRRHKDKYILAPRPEYYDLTADPAEAHNLYRRAGRAAAGRDRLVRDLAGKLDAWPSLGGISTAALQVSAATRHKLESLGYVSSGTRPPGGGPLPDPKSMMPVMQRIDEANAWVRAGRYGQALSVIRKAVAIAPDDARVLQTLGTILLYLERDDEAERALRRSIEARPLSEVCVLLAQLYIKERRFDEAAPVLDRAAALDSLAGGVWIARGDLQALQGDYSDAIKAYTMAKNVDPYRITLAAEERIRQVRAKEEHEPG